MDAIIKELRKSLRERICEVLGENNLCLRQDESDMYYSEIYTDYQDRLSENMIKEVLENSDPLQHLEDYLYDSYMDTVSEYDGEVLDVLEKDEVIQDIMKKLPEDALLNELLEVYYTRIPEEHYLNQNVLVDIILDTGDANYDFVLNCVYPHYNGQYGETINEAASILWLTRQQGYSKSDLNKALREGEYKDSEFLRSMRTEVLNCTSHMNALVFCVQMKLKEVIELNRRINVEAELNKSYYPKECKEKGFVTISKGITCGLYDYWSGAGSVLGISLEKDVKLPIKYIYSALPDGSRGYGIKEIYGTSESLWEYGEVS